MSVVQRKPPTDCHVRVGEYERRDDLPPIHVQTLQRRWPFLVVERLEHVTDRRVYETWIGEDGQKYGRWTWESGLSAGGVLGG